MKPLIVAIGHQKNTAKDSFITMCLDHLRGQTRGVKILRRGFADKIYEFLHSTYGWAGFQTKVFYDENPERKNDLLANMKTARQMLIEVGTPVMRAYDDDVWINAALKTLNFDILFISDLRFPNEFLHCVANEAILVRITRPGLPVPTDIADTALNGWDDKWSLTIDNDGDLNDLYVKAVIFCDTYLSRFYR